MTLTKTTAFAVMVMTVMWASGLSAQSQSAAKRTPKDSVLQSLETAMDLIDKIEDAKADSREYKMLLRDLRKELLRAQVNLERVSTNAEGAPATAANNKKNQFVTIEAPKDAVSRFATVEVKVDSKLMESHECWLAVIPENGQDQAWVQGTKLTGPESKRSVQLGEVITRPEKFLITVLAAPKGKITREGAIAVRQFGEMQIEQHGGSVIERLK